MTASTTLRPTIDAGRRPILRREPRRSATKGAVEVDGGADVSVSLRCRQAQRWSQGRRHRRRSSLSTSSATGTATSAYSPRVHSWIRGDVRAVARAISNRVRGAALCTARATIALGSRARESRSGVALGNVLRTRSGFASRFWAPDMPLFTPDTRGSPPEHPV